MKKKAYLVKVEFVTRVVAGDNEEEFINEVTKNLYEKLQNDEVSENIVSVEEDKECPETEETDSQDDILKITLNDGTEVYLCNYWVCDDFGFMGQPCGSYVDIVDAASEDYLCTIRYELPDFEDEDFDNQKFVDEVSQLYEIAMVDAL